MPDAREGIDRVVAGEVLPEADPDLLALFEALLAVAAEPVALEALLAAAGEGVSRRDAEGALEELARRYERPGHGLLLERAGGGWRLATRPELEGALRAFAGERARSRLSQAALETLAIVAYRQPVTLPEVNFLRGVSSATVLRTLLERRLIRVAGRKRVVGTPLLYRTTREFLLHFGLEDLAALPTLEEVGEAAKDDSSGP
jgi:segregation and condensation protein B